MTPVALWALSAHAASVDLTHPEMLTPQMLRQLVDLSAIESARMTVWFDGTFAPVILGDSGVEPLLDYVAKRTPGSQKDDASVYAEAARLITSVRFDVKVVNDARHDILISVPAIHWGELEAFDGRPTDDAARKSVVDVVSVGLGIWSMFHVSASGRYSPDPSIRGAVETPTRITMSVEGGGLENAVVELERDTLLPTSFRDDETSIGLQYVKSGERYLLAHVDGTVDGSSFGQVDMTFGAVDGVPWPQDMVWRMGSMVLPIHIEDVALKDDVRPFLPAQRAFDPALLQKRHAAPPIDPDNPSGWPAALDAIEGRLYRWAPAEALHFTVARTSDFSTWLSEDFVEKFNKKNRLTMTPPQRGAEIARLSQQVTFDVDVVLSPFSFRVRTVHLGELEQEITAKEVEAIRQRAEKEIYNIVFGAPNYMMLQPGGFFPSTAVATQVETEPEGFLITTASTEGSHQVLLDDETGLPVEIRCPDRTRSLYTFESSPTGTMLVKTVASFTPEGRLETSITYTYGDAEGVTVPTSVKTILSTYTMTSWRVVDATAPFLAKRTGPPATLAK